MQHDEIVGAFDRRPTADDRIEAHVGRTKFRPWTRGRIAVVLAAAIIVPWLPASDAPPADAPAHRARAASGAVVWTFAFSPDAESITTADGSTLMTLRRSDRGWCIDRPPAAGGPVVALSPDGRRRATGGRESVVVTCAPGPAGPGATLEIPVREASDLCFSPDGRTLAVASYRSCEVILWDVESGRPRTILRGHTSSVTVLAFAPDGGTLASAASSDRDVLVWDPTTGEPRHRLAAPGVISIACSPDGRLLAMAGGSEKTARLWDARTGSRLPSIGRHGWPVRSVAFSPDGRLLATAAGDGTAALWDVATGRELRRLDGQAELLRHIAFSPDGRTLAASACDNDLRFWDLGGLVPEAVGP